MSDSVEQVTGGESEDRERKDVVLVRAVAAAGVLVLLLLFLWWFLSRWAPVPDVRGLHEAEAQQKLEAAGFVIGDVAIGGKEGKGVLSQTPPGGSRALKGSPIDLILATGEGYLGFGVGSQAESETPVSFGESGTIVPDVVGETVTEARADLGSDGLVAVTSSIAATLPAGQVLSQDPLAGAVVAEGTSVRLLLSSGISGGGNGVDGVAGVPNVLGMRPSSAASVLRSAGYGVIIRYSASTTSVPKGLVTAQNPGAGDSPIGGHVTVWISTGVYRGGRKWQKPTN